MMGSSLGFLEIMRGSISHFDPPLPPPKMALEAFEIMNPAKPEKLFYRKSRANEGLVFASAERAKFIDQIHRAFIHSKTWGELRKALPEGEYRNFEEMWEPGDHTDDEEDDFKDFLDGSYPAWLQTEMHEVLPKEILESYAENANTMLDGNYWHIDPYYETELVEKLIQLGFEVEKREDLEFW